ncbi:hypothetical protein EDD17DRAFT_1755489 [Pisolithus thermaeus]|nr:hypothetical protein EV401DRAFT_2080434 [Pisolithus croceorrhizus]KAI6163919.1 hypothetical protein EDD17DRAFT_1755489 [Pisolithus thermaeus]
MEKHHDLWFVKWQQKEEQITAWLKKPIRSRKLQITVCSAYKYSMQSVMWELYHDQIQLKHSNMKIEDFTDEQQQAPHDIMEKWNGPDGPTAEVQAQNAKKYGLKYMQNFAEEMWQYCRVRIISLASWKNEWIIQACSMEFNNDIRGSHMFDDIHTISTSWREYLGNRYGNPDTAAGEEVQNITANQASAEWAIQSRRACGKWLAKVPFKKLGKYQANMISSCHLLPNFTFNVDPSHMHISMVMELLNFWKEHQVSHPNDIFTFQKWLDQGGNLQVPRDGSMLPLQVAQKHNTKSQKSPISADDSTDTDDDNTNTEEEATNNMTIAKLSSRGKSSDPRHHHKKIPMPFMCPAHLHTND